MAAEWLVQRGGQEIGPMSSDVLKQLAATGQLAPTDRVRKTSMDRFVRASAVKGLFPSDGRHHAPVVAEESRPAPHGDKKPEPEVPAKAVAARAHALSWAEIRTGSLIAVGGVGALVLLAFLASALRHRGDQDPGTGVVAGGPAIAGDASQPREAAPQGASGGAPISSDQLDRAAKVLADLNVTLGRGRASQDELSDELRALPPDKAVVRALAYLDAGETEANKRTSFLLLRNAANAGEQKAMLALSWYYSSGIGTPASRADAKEWLRKSAEAGLPDGMYEYSVAIRQGEYDGLGDSDGMAWLRRSANAGHPPAVNELKGIQVRGMVTVLGMLFSSGGSNNDDSDAEGPICRGPWELGRNCFCRGFRPYGRAPGGDGAYSTCNSCKHEQSEHRR
jgi:hypothetical protein